MKKMYYLFAVLLIGIAIVSCDKENIDENLVNLKTAYVQSTSTPISDGGIEPVILAVDKPKGGNVTCTDVSQAFNNVVLLCGDKIDYADEVQFEGSFPEWLNVDVNGIYISFDMDECVKINDKYYKVGAVIVKGSNAANVYFYEGGTLSDSHLAAPGDKYMVSNLTFCFIECAQPALKVALKSYMTSGWAVTGGGPEWDYFIGYEDFKEGASYPIYLWGGLANIAGILEVGNFDDDSLLEVRITSTNGMDFTEAYLYVGIEEKWSIWFLTYPNPKMPSPPSNVVIFNDINVSY